MDNKFCGYTLTGISIYGDLLGPCCRLTIDKILNNEILKFIKNGDANDL
jgi:hypothetical protein